MSSFIFLIVIILLVFYVNCIDCNLILKNLEEIYCCIENYYTKSCKKETWCFPSTNILKYFPCQGGNSCNPHPQVCNPHPQACNPNNQSFNPPKSHDKNVINFNCGQQSSSSNKCCSSKKYSCKDYCIKNNEVILGSYKYEIDKISGIINKYNIDKCRNPIEETREIIYHSLGYLNKIYINSGKIIVEDSYSTEHIANIDANTGILNF